MVNIKTTKACIDFTGNTICRNLLDFSHLYLFKLKTSKAVESTDISIFSLKLLLNYSGF